MYMHTKIVLDICYPNIMLTIVQLYICINVTVCVHVPGVSSVVAVVWNLFLCWPAAQTSVQQPVHLQKSADHAFMQYCI